MGIDRDDTVIRRRLRQKFEFLTDDMAAASVPTDEELASYLAANADAFATDTTYTFEQVYFNPDQGGVDLDRQVAEMLAALRAGNDPGGGWWAATPLFREHACSLCRRLFWYGVFPRVSTPCQ